MSKLNVFLLLAISVGLITGATVAQTSTQDDQDLSPAAIFGAVDMASIHEKLTDSALRVTDRYLDHMSKAETTERLAKFQKRYYDALVKEGFTEDQAFAIVREGGSPLAQMPRR